LAGSEPEKEKYLGPALFLPVRRTLLRRISERDISNVRFFYLPEARSD